MKRKQIGNETSTPTRSSKRLKPTLEQNGQASEDELIEEPSLSPRSTLRTPRRRKQSQKVKDNELVRRAQEPDDFNDENEVGSPTPKANGHIPLSTLKKSQRKGKQKPVTPGRSKAADRSAKKKSVTILQEQEDEDDWDGGNALAQEILEEEDELVDGDAEDALPSAIEIAQDAIEAVETAETPSKRRPGRPKGARNKRSPTPEGDIAPEERYFFQNRSGPPQVSAKTLSSLKLLTHDEYFEQIRRYKDHHEPEKLYLMKLHARAFPQWRFEHSEGFNICVYGYGSKRKLLLNYADWISRQPHSPSSITVINGYYPKLNIRQILQTIIAAYLGDSNTKSALRTGTQPNELAERLLSFLTSDPPSTPLLLIINSFDSPALRKSSTQSLLSRLAAHPSINLLCSADSPTFQIMLSNPLRDAYSLAFHDCSTFAAYDAELSVVDSVHELFGRQGMRAGGKEGVGFVLRSLPENARRLYGLLVTEILTVLGEDEGGGGEEGDGPGNKRKLLEHEETGVEIRGLYEKASAEFICHTETGFRYLLKEFHDHQMIWSRKEAGGTEVMGVPLSREDMEGILEEVVV